MEGLIQFTGIVMIAFGILQIILFFKIWGMTNNVKRIWKKIDNKDFLSDACVSYIKGNLEETERLANEAFLQEVALLSKSSESYEDWIDNYIKIKEEIQKVFYNDKYVGLVFKNASTDRPYRIEVYNSSGSQILNSTVDMDFENVTFAGDNILMYSDMRCEILSIKGVKKFQTNFKGQIYGLMPYDDSKTYLLMTNSKIQKIRLK